MIKVTYQTERLLSYIKDLIKDFEPERVVWLGFSPGFSCVYKLLLELGIKEVMVCDNDPQKQGWKIEAAGSEKDNLQVLSFDAIGEKNDNSLFLSANTHYEDFVRQLSEKGIDKERIIDLNKVLEAWMWEEENGIVENYHQLIGRELQLEQLKILKWFRDYCDANNYRWCLGEGTLLGAIRHKGFIPWDDDIDVFMPYEDYLKCIEQFPKDKDYYILDWRTESDYPFQFAKVVEKNTYQIHAMPFGYFTLGCYIDIFPIAGFPSDEDQIKRKYHRHKELDARWDSTLLVRNMYGDICPDCRQEITDEKYALGFDDAKMIGTMQQIAGNAWAVSRDVFAETINMQFEDDMFPVPKGYDVFLTARYGDYMTPPPENKRRIHSYPTYVM